MTSTSATSDLLAGIVAATRTIVETRALRVPLREMERRAAASTPHPGSFKRALERKDRINVIAECKRRSPSRGVLRQDYDAASIAQAYEQAGAAAISVLTEPTFFDGSLDDLEAVRRSVEVPVLRKDFVVDPYQVLEARAAGADALLLIVATLTPGRLKELHAMATGLDVAVVVEVHDEGELEAAASAGASIIGVNNRNLRTLEVDTGTSDRVMSRMPSGVIAVAESGLKTGDDLTRLRRAGYGAFLIGERMMTDPDPGGALSRLLEQARNRGLEDQGSGPGSGLGAHE